jgi:hypothetical protein
MHLITDQGSFKSASTSGIRMLRQVQVPSDQVQQPCATMLLIFAITPAVELG